MKNPLTPKQTERAMNALYGNSTEPIRKARKKPVQREDNLQKACLKWFDLQFPDLYYSLYHVPNQRKNNLRQGRNGQWYNPEGSKLKQMGVRPGISDLVFSYQGVTSYIELKSKSGSQTPDQKEFQDHITQQGFEYYIIDSFEDFQSLIRTLTDQRAYNGKTKTEIGA